MTPEEALKIIWKHRKLCWHEWIAPNIHACKFCGENLLFNPYPPHPNDWLTFGNVWTWAKGEEWFQEFIGCYHGSADVDLGLLVEVDLIGPALFPEVAEFLEGRK